MSQLVGWIREAIHHGGFKVGMPYKTKLTYSFTHRAFACWFTNLHSVPLPKFSAKNARIGLLSTGN